jgi:hypothetical protein
VGSFGHCGGAQAWCRVRATPRSARLKLVGEGQSYREISHRLGLSKNTVLDIVKRNRATLAAFESVACLEFRFVSSPLDSSHPFHYRTGPASCARGFHGALTDYRTQARLRTALAEPRCPWLLLNVHSVRPRRTSVHQRMNFPLVLRLCLSRHSYRGGSFVGQVAHRIQLALQFDRIRELRTNLGVASDDVGIHNGAEFLR